MAASPKRFSKMPSVTEFGGAEEGLIHMKMSVTVEDIPKMLGPLGIRTTLSQTNAIAERNNGKIVYEEIFQLCKAAGKIDKTPRGGSFSGDQWKTFTDWWTMRLAFDMADKNGDLHLDMAEVERLHAENPGVVTWAWDEMSVDDGGAVPFAEFQAWWAMRQNFDMMDKDASGTLDQSEMKEMARKLGIVDFEVADLDLTATGAVPFDEFQAWWRMRMMFIHADKSGEGHLTRQEVKELARTLGIQISVRSMDIDGDDCIDFSEFFAWWNMRHKFDKFDKAKKGNLTYEEASELATSLGADVNFAEMDEDGDGLVDFKEFTEWYKMRRCFEKIDISGDGQLDHVEIKRLAYMLNMDLKIEDIDQDGGGEVDFQEFQKWWGGNKTRAQVMSRVAMQMDRDAANAVEEEPGLPAILFVGIALMLTALLLVPVIATIYSQYTIDGLDLIDCEEKKELVANAPGSLLHPACA